MLNGYPELMDQAKRRGIHFGTAALPGRDGPAKGGVGVTDWMMAFKHDGDQAAVRTFSTSSTTTRTSLTSPPATTGSPSPRR